VLDRHGDGRGRARVGLTADGRSAARVSSIPRSSSSASRSQEDQSSVVRHEVVETHDLTAPSQDGWAVDYRIRREDGEELHACSVGVGRLAQPSH
jgi:hypothetical protein